MRLMVAVLLIAASATASADWCFVHREKCVVKMRFVGEPVVRGLCRCNAEGNLACECQKGVCGDTLCPTKPVPLSETFTRGLAGQALAGNKGAAATAPEFSHWEYVRSCGPNGCTMQRVARYRVHRRGIIR